MARRTDKTGKTGAGQLPAEIYKFPQSGPTSHTDAEPGAPPPNLSSTEQRLYDELLALARKLDRRGAPGVLLNLAGRVENCCMAANPGRMAALTAASRAEEDQPFANRIATNIVKAPRIVVAVVHNVGWS